MFESIFKDFKYALENGNTITKIILVNVCVFVFVKLVYVFTGGSSSSFYPILVKSLSISSNPLTILQNPWSIITHMVLHEGFWHIIWNMLLLFWFGRIVGDFLGDHRVIPIYILGGLSGALLFILGAQFFGSGTLFGSYALGASAAVMAIILVAASKAPDYIMRLILIGPVKIKYIAGVLVFLDIVSAAGAQNTGGAFGHLGGAGFGILYVYYLNRGTDLTQGMRNLFAFFRKEYKPTKKQKEYIKVVHKDLNNQKNASHSSRFIYDQKKIDAILDKINEKGYESLSSEEKEILYNASKK